jgi:hypothetical protein
LYLSQVGEPKQVGVPEDVFAMILVLKGIIKFTEKDSVSKARDCTSPSDLIY